MKQTDIPIWERYTLTIEDASKYFRIGENKLRRLAEENKNANWLIMNGNRIQIKRKQFEKIIDTLETYQGDRPAMEQLFLRLHYRRLPHVHLLVADGVQYGARGFVGLQRKVCDMRHPKGNENGRLYIYIEGGRCDRYREGVELSQRRSTA